MKRYQVVFIVLVYKNSDDLLEFIDSVHDKTEQSKIIVINSFFDEESMKRIKKIATDHECDFFNVDNKGYGFGNNFGIEKALEMYDFKYLVISNPDIIVKKFDVSHFQDGNIYCGVIKTLNNKNQNPCLVIENRVSDYLIYQGHKNNSKLIFYIGIAINKIIREIFNIYTVLSRKEVFNVYAPHGSFVVFSKKALIEFLPVFDEKIFLFNEEYVLAKKARRKGIPVLMTEAVVCLHKEDGSMKLWDGSIGTEHKKSFIYYYEKYGLANRGDKRC